MTDIVEYSSININDLLGRQLNNIESKYAPKSVYYEGNIKIPSQNPKVSIVGSRKASRNGLSSARDISKMLIEKSVTIVSGLAKGIDTVGHTTAIENDGQTIAVIGTPLNKVYPKENFELQQEIKKKPSGYFTISSWLQNNATRFCITKPNNGINLRCYCYCRGRRF